MNFRQETIRRVSFFVTTLAFCFGAGMAAAQPGTLITTVNLPVSGQNVNVAVDCIGNVYFTNFGSNNLYKMDKAGALLSTTPVLVGGVSLVVGEMAWDSSRSQLWAAGFGSNPNIYRIDPATGVATLIFNANHSTNIGSFVDGLAYDGTDDTIWVSTDVSTTIEHYTSAGTFLGQITPKNAAGGNLGSISGVIVGAGDLLYLGQDGAVRIVQVKKSDGTFIASFASPGGTRDEGLECDSVNFAPKLAIWSREFNLPGSMSVIEVAPGTCGCGGAPPGAGSVDVPVLGHPGRALLILLLVGAGLYAIRRFAA